MRISDLDIDRRIVKIFEEQGIDELYPPQEDAVKFALQSRNLVLAIPTASGKSLVAYLAMLRSVLRGGKAIYIVPLRALASEKYDDLLPFKSLGINISLSYGDLDSEDPELERFDIIIATSEKADSLLRHRSFWLKKISVIVADEVHLINDAGRGPTLEIIISRFKQINPDAQIIALSATIQNSEEIAEWLGAEHVKSDWRPVTLKEGVFLHDTIFFKDNETKRIEIVGDEITSIAIDTIENEGQCLIFVNTRRSTESVANSLGKTVRKRLTENELLDLEEISNELIECQSEPTSVGESIARSVRNGVAFHHAGLTNQQRKIVESYFKIGKIKCIVATPTLAAGINLPARCVIIRDLTRYDSNFGLSPIPILEIKQMMGRAGRPKYDKIGEAVAIARSLESKEEILENYILRESEPIYSKLGAENALRMHILSSIATRYTRNREELMDFINSTFFAHQTDVWSIEGRIENVIDFLRANELIKEGRNLEPTEFGRRTSELYIDPLSAVLLRKALERAGSVKTTALSFLHAVSATPDIVLSFLRRGDYEWVQEVVFRHEDEFLLSPSECDDYEMFLAEVKTACILLDWINEVSENDITKKYSIGPGDIRTRVETGEWLVYSMKELARLFAPRCVRDLGKLMLRIRHGIKEELLELIKLRGIGRVRARALFGHGYKSIEDLKGASVKELERLPLIGRSIAESIKGQVEDL